MNILQPWPEHQNPTQNRIASAPYNFVPLPEKIIPAVDSADDLPDHDKYYPDLLSGYFDVTLTTRSPLYIRGPLPRKDLSRQEELKNKPEFFHTTDEQKPVIPGSSLRGMLRALLEIVSYSKIQWVSHKQLFFRTVDKTTIGNYYRARIGDRVETGFLIRKGDTYFIKVCSMARIKRSMISNNINKIYEGKSPNQIPRWQGQPGQHASVWVRMSNKTDAARRPNIVEGLSYQMRNDMVEGRLVITGDAPRKSKEFVFLLPTKDAEEIRVSEDIVRHFIDDDQLTQWQKDAFPTNQPKPDYRERDGMLGTKPTAPGDPIFFLREKGILTFIGRARMFRLPYTRSPFDLIDLKLSSPKHIDYAEALFGFVRTHQELDELGNNKPEQGKKGRAYAGRVIVTDGVLIKSDQQNIWLTGDFDEKITPKILATPKPTAFQHYLTQQRPNELAKLDHYDSAPPSDKTTIRGHKLYWHQGLGTKLGLTLEEIRTAIEELPSKEPAKEDKKDTQHTSFKPLRPEVQFSFRVYFENLSHQELGALCWILHPHGEQGRSYCHHLGMGKPLGMGAVELQACLHIIKRPSRYKKLFNESRDKWELGEESTVEDLAKPEVLTRMTQPFEKHLLSELNPDPPCTRLADMQRIAMLLKLLEWPGYRAEEGEGLYLARDQRPNTRYMKLEEYRYRPVLPDPKLFDGPYFTRKSRPQELQADQMRVNQAQQLPTLEQQHSRSEAYSQVATVQQAPVENSGQKPVLSPDLAELFTIGKELRNLNNFTRDDQGVNVRFWDLDPMKVIGFIPKGMVDRELGNRISVVVTDLRQEASGRLVVELSLRSRK